MAETFIQLPKGLLKRLHHLQSHVGELQSQIDRGPRQIAAAQAIVDKSVLARDEVKTRVDAATALAEDKQRHLKHREDKVVELEGKLNSAATNKEFAMLKEQIAADRQANEVLNDEIFEVLERIDALNVELAAAQDELNEHQAQKSERETAIKTRLEEVQVDLDDKQKELSEEVSRLPGEARQLYDRLVGSLGADAMGGTEGNSCGNCNQILRTQIIDHLQMDRMTQCPNCHALLYISD